MKEGRNQITQEYYREPNGSLLPLVEDHNDRLGRIETALVDMTAEIAPALASLQREVTHMVEALKASAADIRQLRDFHQANQLAEQTRDVRIKALEKAQEAHQGVHSSTKGQVLAVFKWLLGVGTGVAVAFIVYRLKLK